MINDIKVDNNSNILVHKNNPHSEYSTLRWLSPNIIQILQHLNFHQLQQLLLTFIIQIMVNTELIHYFSYFLLITCVEFDLIHFGSHVDVDYQERFVVVAGAVLVEVLELVDWGGFALGCLGVVVGAGGDALGVVVDWWDCVGGFVGAFWFCLFGWVVGLSSF